MCPVEEKSGSPAHRSRFRQTRFSESADSLTLLIRDFPGVVRNWSRTGIAFVLPDGPALALGDTVQEVEITCNGIQLYQGSICIRTLREEEGLKIYGASFAGDLFLVDGVDAALSASAFAEQLFTEAKNIEEMNPQVCQILLALRRSLGSLREFCTKTEAKWRDLSFDSRCEAERILLPFLSRKITELLTHFNLRISSLIDVDALEIGSAYHQLFSQEIAPLFESADFPRRAFAKPRGYAGDYEMMNQIYRNGFEGTDLYGRIISQYGASEAAGESVRFRRDYFREHFTTLLDRVASPAILSIASGPAVEVQEFCRETDATRLRNVHFTLCDLDAEALEHAQSKIHEVLLKTDKQVRVDYLNASVKSFLTSRSHMDSAFDFIYSAGLFDYLDNMTSAALVRHFSRMLKPGGKMVIGNFTKENPTKAFLHLIFDWNLIHKTEQEILSWGDGIPGCSVDLEFDTNRINAFVVITKNGTDKIG